MGLGETVPPPAPAIQGKRILLCAQPSIPHPSPAPAWDKQPPAPTGTQGYPRSTRQERQDDTVMENRRKLGPVPPCAAAGWVWVWVWVSLPLVFYLGLKLYAGAGDAPGNLQRQMVGEKRKGRRMLPVGMGTQHPGRERGVNSQR